MEDALKSDIALDAYDVLKRIGAPGAYTDERRIVEIKNYSGEIPSDLLYIKEVNFLKPGQDGRYIELPMQYVIGNKTSHWHCSGARDLKIRSEYGYSINPGVINTDIPNGKIVIYYKSIEMDENGFPLIPDVPGVIDAIVAYAKLRHFQIKSDLNLIPQTAVNRVERDYLFAIHQAEMSLKLPSPDEYKSIARSLLRLIKGINYNE